MIILAAKKRFFVSVACFYKYAFSPILLFLLFLKLSSIFNCLLPCGTEFVRELNFSDRRFQDVFVKDCFFF